MAKNHSVLQSIFEKQVEKEVEKRKKLWLKEYQGQQAVEPVTDDRMKLEEAVKLIQEYLGVAEQAPVKRTRVHWDEALLAKLVEEGKSAKEIAEVLGRKLTDVRSKLSRFIAPK